MRCYTKSECQDWLRDRHRELPTSNPQLHRHRETLKDLRSFTFTHWFAKHSTFEEGVLLWLTEWGIWKSSENYHLFYKLRQTFGEGRLLHEAPGLYFLSHEMDDFATMLQVCIDNGWGGYILTDSGYINCFFSHDEWIDFFAAEAENLSQVKKWFSL